MDVTDVVDAILTAGLWIGVGVGTLIAIVIALLPLWLLMGRRDDGYRVIGEAEPPAPRVSPFAVKREK
jgi:hypothetical protein